MTKQKTVFESPYFWAAVGGLGLAYYLYKKKNPNATVSPNALQGGGVKEMTKLDTTSSPVSNVSATGFIPAESFHTF